MKFFFKKFFNKKRKSISPLIAIILLIVVAVAIITIILTWSRTFTDDSLEFSVDIISDKSNLDGFIKQNTNIPTNNVILENIHPSKPITIVGYKIHSKKDAFNLNKYLYLEDDFNLPSITILPNQMQELYMVCFPESYFSLELVLNDNTYLNINIRENNFDFSKCSENIVTQYTITFDSAGGSSVTPITQDYNTSVTSPPDPTRTGYTFNGWSPALPANMPAENNTHTAQWTANSYDVTFKANGGDGADYTQSITFDTSANLTLNTFTRTGYTFNGWNTQANGSGTAYADQASFTMDVEGQELFAQWTINEYTLIYIEGDNGSITGDLSQTINHGEDGTEVIAVPDEGYVFITWSDGVLTESRIDTGVTGNISVTAEFEEIICSGLPYIEYSGNYLCIHPLGSGYSQWGCRNQEVGVSAKSDYDGKSNTAAIIAFHNDTSNFGGNSYYDCTSGSGGTCEVWGCHSGNNGTVAAKVCDDLEFDGFDDWYLPARSQLEGMYYQRNNVVFGDYEGVWNSYSAQGLFSSTEYSSSYVYGFHMSGGFIYDFHFKTSTWPITSVRCVRDP